jgi:D-alanyl-D-alanine carboxypeptidase
VSGRAAKAAGIGATAASNEVLPPALRRLHDYFTYLVDEVGNLAIVAGMQRLGGPRSYVTYGHRTVDRTIVATKDDIFQIGSQSKLLLALLFIVLAKKDRIELDHPVRQFAPVDLDERITIRHLLMNQSGLGEFTRALDPCRLDPRIIYEPRDLIALARPQGQLFAPGQCFDYCNTGWVVAAMAAERITGQGYAAAIDEHVLAPLGLGRTAIGNPQEAQAHARRLPRHSPVR